MSPVASSKHPNLLSSFKLDDNLELSNRVVMAPLTRGRAGPDYLANDLMAEYYAQRASAGLIITEATQISLAGRGWFEAGEIYTAEHVAGWRKVTDAVHARGGVIFCQLWHTGRTSHSSFRKGLPGFEGDKALPVAPSALKRKSQGTTQRYTPGGVEVEIETPIALTKQGILDTIEDFGHAAQCAKDAGFDGVEVHGANGYLIDEFLQSVSNTRTDEYGGSVENRFRFAQQVLDKVLTVFPSSRVGFRLSPNGAYNGMGSPDNYEAFVYYTKRLSDYQLGYLHVMTGAGFVPFHDVAKHITAEEFRKVFKGTLMVNTGYTAETGETAVKNNVADLVAFGRPFIANPDLVERFANAWPLNDVDFSKLCSEVNNRMAEEGYTDYPTYSGDGKKTEEG